MTLEDLTHQHAIHCETYADAKLIYQLCIRHPITKPPYRHLRINPDFQYEFGKNTCYYPMFNLRSSLDHAIEQNYVVVSSKEFYKTFFKNN
jgi:hypothetical protein